MCKLNLLQTVAARIRTCELSHYSLANNQLCKLDSDGDACKNSSIHSLSYFDSPPPKKKVTKERFSGADVGDVSK